MTVATGLSARRVCWMETESWLTAMFVSAMSSVTSTVTSEKPFQFALQLITPHVDGLIRKSGTSMMHVTMHDMAEKATGADESFSSDLVSMVFRTATAM
eukprot:6750395-Prymnesium_polylepis.1